MNLITDVFRDLTRARLAAVGRPDLPVICLPHPTAPLDVQQVGQLADTILADVLRHAGQTP